MIIVAFLIAGSTSFQSRHGAQHRLQYAVARCLCARRWVVHGERDRSLVSRSLVIQPTCPNILVPLAAGACLSEKRISMKYEETVTEGYPASVSQYLMVSGRSCE